MNDAEVQAFAAAVNEPADQVVRRARVPDLPSTYEQRRLERLAETHERLQREISRRGVRVPVQTYEQQTKVRDRRIYRPRLGPRCPAWVRMLNQAEELERDAATLRKGAEVLRLMDERKNRGGT